MPSLPDLLQTLMQMDGSDLHLTTGTPPRMRVHGRLQPLDAADLSASETKRLTYSILTDAQRARFEQARELDFAFSLDTGTRIRGNLFHQRGAVAAVYRVIPDRIRSVEELGLPAAVAAFADRPRGIVLVTGPTGSGKSTTLAALLDRINRQRQGHILTIEDPIEFVHPHRRCVVNQREVHADTASFSAALRAALREDPDVVLIGEMRDLETVEAALRIAETGHLTFATAHTNSASQTIHRIVDTFPSSQQDQIRKQLSLVLEGIVCQVLVSRAGGGRVAALEILVPTPAIRSLIRDGKIHQIYSAMQTGHERVGMQTMNRSLAALYRSQQITRDTALTTSSNPEELQDLLAHGPRHTT